MALTQEGAQLTERHRREQLLIARELIAQLRIAWPQLDLDDLSGSAPGWSQLALRILQLEFGKSVQASNDYIIDFIRAERKSPRATIAFDDILLLDERAPLMLQMAGPVKIKQNITAGMPLDEARKAAFAELAREAQRLVLNGGRRRIRNHVSSDPRALGFQRVTDGNPCYFCAMLASRGPVYKDSSFADSDNRFIGKGTARVHNGCGCSLEPVYGRGTDWVGNAEEWSGLWQSSASGLRPADAIRAFRQAYNEAREES